MLQVYKTRGICLSERVHKSGGYTVQRQMTIYEVEEVENRESSQREYQLSIFNVPRLMFTN